VGDRQKTSSTVEKAFSILELVSQKEAGGTSLAEVSKYLHVSKSTAHRYLTTLEELDVLRRDDSDEFNLGPKLIELSGAFLSRQDLRNESQASLEQLAAQTEETVHLAIPSGDEVVYIAKVDSPHSVRMASHIGALNPMHCTALGKAILAHFPPDRVNEIMARGLPRRTSHTLTTPERLRDELERVRTQGIATDDQENELGVRCAGAPIFDYAGKVVGAISVSGPAVRITKERVIEMGPLVKQAAREISRRMGHQPRLPGKRAPASIASGGSRRSEEAT
jgi:IclR family acetate operon transcriptional repressor